VRAMQPPSSQPITLERRPIAVKWGARLPLHGCEPRLRRPRCCAGLSLQGSRDEPAERDPCDRGAVSQGIDDRTFLTEIRVAGAPGCWSHMPNALRPRPHRSHPRTSARRHVKRRLSGRGLGGGAVSFVGARWPPRRVTNTARARDAEQRSYRDGAHLRRSRATRHGDPA